MAVHQKDNHLFLVDLDQELEGFRQFISCWIYRNKDKTILVDPGPTSTIPVLIKALDKLNIIKVDYILLTHIHIDHAGGSGALLSQFPEAKVLCHPRGIPHMINPDKLWLGSLSVLGNIAEKYKPITPVPPDKIFYESKIEDQIGIEIIETPGHAMHHLNFLIDGFLFAGEVAGVSIPVENNFYLRIATPPRFIYQVYKDSLYKAADINCDKICFGHYNMRDDVKNVFNAAKEQLKLWMNTTRSAYEKNPSINPQEIFEDLLSVDSSITCYYNLDKNIRQREKYFALNSIKGMLEYLERSKNTNHSQ